MVNTGTSFEFCSRLEDRAHVFVDMSSVTSPTQLPLLLFWGRWTHTGQSIEKHTHLNNSLCLLIHDTKHTHRNTHAVFNPYSTIYIHISFIASLFVISWITTWVVFPPSLSSCHFFCLTNHQEQTYGADRSLLPVGTHLGCPGKPWRHQLPHFSW